MSFLRQYPRNGWRELKVRFVPKLCQCQVCSDHFKKTCFKREYCITLQTWIKKALTRVEATYCSDHISLFKSRMSDKRIEAKQVN